MERQISVEDWKKMDPEQTVLVDVREEAQTQFGTIEGALYIPATSLHKLYELPKDKKIVVKYPDECWHCRACAIDCPVQAITLRYPLSHMMLHVDVPKKEC